MTATNGKKKKELHTSSSNDQASYDTSEEFSTRQATTDSPGVSFACWLQQWCPRLGQGRPKKFTGQAPTSCKRSALQNCRNTATVLAGNLSCSLAPNEPCKSPSSKVGHPLVQCRVGVLSGASRHQHTQTALQADSEARGPRMSAPEAGLPKTRSPLLEVQPVLEEQPVGLPVQGQRVASP